MKKLKENFYSEVGGDYDEKAYNSSLFIQKFWQRHKIESVIKYVEPGGLVLDLGSGSGVVSDKILNIGHEVVAADISAGKIKNCLRRNSKILGVVCDGRNLPFKGETFDRVVCVEVIEHIHEAGKCLSEIRRVLREKGELVLTTPNYASPWPVVEYLWDTLGHGIDYRLQHVSTFNKNSLVRCLHSEGFKVMNVKTIFLFTPISSLISERLTMKLLGYEESILEFFGIGMLVITLSRRGD